MYGHQSGESVCGWLKVKREHLSTGICVYETLKVAGEKTPFFQRLSN